ncbi:cytochrome P450 90D2-like isoform X2 [Phalaenopsis equestris]|uniref:cytochrome P450 90D2-like isoform X2 n=1 Tax=Phalaenopsis equestris TaxID=78828 RepID=UPI0009E4995D|nr:cytochrome P450 90D2-like isoform X2 [Phalaenopsis equestris]
MNRRRLLYGKVFKSHLFGTPTIISTDADVTRFILQSDARSFVPSYPKSLSELMGKSSILLINGALQRRLHGLIGAFFKSPHLKSQITADMQSYVGRAMDSWSEARPILIQDETKHILVKGLIGLEPGEELCSLKRDFHEFIAGLMSLPLNFPGTRLYRSLKAKQRMVMVVKKIIEEKRRRKSLGLFGMSAVDAVDVLINDTSGDLTDEMISDNMIDLMIPAEDSVPVLITLAVKYLSSCPAALRQLEEENMRLVERKSRLGQECLQWNDYMSLSFTQDVITETLRLGNIIGGIMRKAVRDVEVKGHLIPNGWCVFTYFRSVHLDEAIYDEPHRFNPWRWKGRDTSSCSFTPFGGGQRLCPGIDLARLEAAIFLHHLVTSFTWVADEDQVVNFPTVRMKSGLPVRVKRREVVLEQLSARVGS